MRSRAVLGGLGGAACVVVLSGAVACTTVLAITPDGETAPDGAPLGDASSDALGLADQSSSGGDGATPIGCSGNPRFCEDFDHVPATFPGSLVPSGGVASTEYMAMVLPVGMNPPSNALRVLWFAGIAGVLFKAVPTFSSTPVTVTFSMNALALEEAVFAQLDSPSVQFRLLTKGGEFFYNPGLGPVALAIATPLTGWHRWRIEVTTVGTKDSQAVIFVDGESKVAASVRGVLTTGMTVSVGIGSPGAAIPRVPHEAFFDDIRVE